MRGTQKSGKTSNKGNATLTVFELLVDEHGMGVVCDHHIDYEAATFSDGFMSAIRRGALPILGSEEQCPATQKGREYHHFLLNGDCYVAYFD